MFYYYCNSISIATLYMECDNNLSMLTGVILYLFLIVCKFVVNKCVIFIVIVE